MKATVFPKFSDASAVVTIEPGVPLYESLGGVMPEGAKYFADGREVPGDYIPKDGQVIMARAIPSGLVTTIIVIVAIVSLGGAIYAGVTAYQARKKANELEEQIKNSMAGMNDSVQNLPHIRGARNSVATGKTQPYIIGEHLFTPYKLTQHWYKTEGTDGANQYYIDVYECGFNSQVLRELRAEEAILKDFGSGSTPQEGVYALDADSPFYDATSLIEISQDGAAFATSEFNIKVVSEEPGQELKKADDAKYEDLIYIVPRYARSTDVCILFNGLRTYGDDGASQTRTVVVTPSYSVDGGTNWTPFTFDQNGTPSNTFARNTLNQLRFVAHIDYVYAVTAALTEPIQIKLVCSTNKATNSAYDQVFVESVQSTIYNVEASAAANDFVNEKIIDDVEAALSTRLGLKILATQSNQEKLTRVNIITAGIARTWNGAIWSATKTPTRNPAAWILEILTSPTHKASQMADADIDLDAFGEAYEYYDTEGTTIDLVLISGEEKRGILAALCEVGACSLYRNIYGEVSIAIDSPKENAIAVLNTQNLLSFEAEKGFNRKADGLRVSYISRLGGYQQDSYLVMRDGVTRGANSLIRDVETAGITEYENIVKYARRLLAIETLRPKVARAKVGKEGIYYTPLSLVYVQHPALGNGLGSAEIKTVIEEAGYITGLVLREPIEYDSAIADGFGMIIQAVGADYSVPLACEYTADTDGMVDTVVLGDPIAIGAAVIPHVGDILSYGYLSSGEFTTITSPMLITEIEDADEGFLLSLVDYSEAIYDAGTIPDYEPNITTRGISVAVPPAPSDGVDSAMSAAAASAAAAHEASIRMTVSASRVLRSRAGALAPEDLTLTAYYSDNNAAYAGRFTIEVSTDGANYNEIYASTSDESSHVEEDIDATYGGSFIVLIRCRLYKAGGTTILYEQQIVGVSADPSAASIYWGPLTSAPTVNIQPNDYYFDNNNVAGGGGVIRYYTGSAWVEATSAWAGYYTAISAAMNDMVAWTRIYGASLIAAVNAMIENLTAQTAFVQSFYAQDATITGRQRWYYGIGVHRICIEIYNGKISFYDAPDTTPPTAETLRAAFGQLGAGEIILLDGNVQVPITSGNGAEQVFTAASISTPKFVQRANGERWMFYVNNSYDIAYRTFTGEVASSEQIAFDGISSISNIDAIEDADGILRVTFRYASTLNEIVWDESSWSEPEEIIGNHSAPCYHVAPDGTLRLFSIDLSNDYLCKSVLTGYVWGEPENVIEAATGYVDVITIRDGTTWIAYSRNSDNYLCEREYTDDVLGSETVVNSAVSRYPAYVENFREGVSLYYRRNSDKYIVYRNKVNGTYGDEIPSLETACAYPSLTQLIDGKIAFTYDRDASPLGAAIVFLRRYARLGAGIEKHIVSADGKSEYWLMSDHTVIQKGWSFATGNGTGYAVTSTITLPYTCADASKMRIQQTICGYKDGSDPAYPANVSGYVGGVLDLDYIVSTSSIVVGAIGTGPIPNGRRIVVCWEITGTW